jgi:hypothetical protein
MPRMGAWWRLLLSLCVRSSVGSSSHLALQRIAPLIPLLKLGRNRFLLRRLLHRRENADESF